MDVSYLIVSAIVTHSFSGIVGNKQYNKAVDKLAHECGARRAQPDQALAGTGFDTVKYRDVDNLADKKCHQ